MRGENLLGSSVYFTYSKSSTISIGLFEAVDYFLISESLDKFGLEPIYY